MAQLGSDTFANAHRLASIADAGGEDDAAFCTESDNLDGDEPSQLSLPLIGSRTLVLPIPHRCSA